MIGVATDVQRISWVPGTDLSAVAREIRHGALVAFPTETVFGLAGLYGDERVRERIFRAKGRPEAAPLPVQMADVDALRRWWPALPEEISRLAARFWPGPLTMVLPAGADSIGVRIPRHPLALALLAAVGEPMWVTSANRSGEPPLMDPNAVAAAFAGEVAFLIEGGPAGGGAASTVIDLTNWPLRWRMLRQGPISDAQIEDVLGIPEGREAQG